MVTAVEIAFIGFVLGLVFLAVGLLFPVIGLLPVMRFAYPVATARVMRSKMLGGDRIEQLVESYNADDVVASVEGTVYEKYLPEKWTLKQMEESFAVCLADAYARISAQCPSNTAPFFRLLKARYDVENIKRILSAKFAGEGVGKLYPSNLSEAFWERLANAASVEEAVELLQNTEYKEMFEREGAGENVTKLNQAADRYLYEHLLEAGHLGHTLATAGVLNDAKSLTRVYGMQADILNVKLALRCKRDGLNAEQTKELLLNNGLEVDARARDGLAEAEGVEGVMAALEKTPYGAVLQEAMAGYAAEGKLVKLEKALDRHHYGVVKNQFIAQPFGLTPLACFLLLKEREIKNLQTILKGLETEMPKEDLRELLVAA